MDTPLSGLIYPRREGAFHASRKRAKEMWKHSNRLRRKVDKGYDSRYIVMLTIPSYVIPSEMRNA